MQMREAERCKIFQLVSILQINQCSGTDALEMSFAVWFDSLPYTLANSKAEVNPEFSGKGLTFRMGTQHRLKKCH